MLKLILFHYITLICHKKNHEVTLAPKDHYGIPILPSTAELDISQREKGSSPLSEDLAFAFDHASYGVWSTIMNLPSDDDTNAALKMKLSLKASQSNYPLPTVTTPKGSPLFSLTSSCDSILLSGERLCTPPERGDRLEEFASAFLGMSVFDLADVWIPDLNRSGDVRLNHLCSVSVADRNEGLNCLMEVSQNLVIKARSGVIGKVYNSGNPIWGTNQVSQSAGQETLAVITLHIPSFDMFAVNSPLFESIVKLRTSSLIVSELRRSQEQMSRQCSQYQFIRQIMRIRVAYFAAIL